MRATAHKHRYIVAPVLEAITPEGHWYVLGCHECGTRWALTGGTGADVAGARCLHCDTTMYYVERTSPPKHLHRGGVGLSWCWGECR